MNSSKLHIVKHKVETQEGKIILAKLLVKGLIKENNMIYENKAHFKFENYHQHLIAIYFLFFNVKVYFEDQKSKVSFFVL